MFRQSERHINYAVNAGDTDRIVNASKPLISVVSFQEGFQPQLPIHCLKVLERFREKSLVPEDRDTETYEAIVQYHPFHMNQLTDKDYIHSRTRPSTIDGEYLPPNMVYQEVEIKRRQNLDNSTRKTRAPEAPAEPAQHE